MHNMFTDKCFLSLRARAGAYALSCHDNNSLMTIPSRGEIISSLISFHGVTDLNREMVTCCSFISSGVFQYAHYGGTNYYQAGDSGVMLKPAKQLYLKQIHVCVQFNTSI